MCHCKIVTNSNIFTEQITLVYENFSDHLSFVC